MSSILAVICAGLFFAGFCYGGYLNPNVLDLAPNHAGTLFGLTNTFANFGMFCKTSSVYFILSNFWEPL